MSLSVEIIRQNPLLNDLSKKEIEAHLVPQSIFKKFTKDQIIHFEGEICDHWDVIFGGEVSVDRIDKEGNLLNISTFTYGDAIGGNLLFSKSPFYPMTTTAVTDTELLSIKKSAILKLCQINQEFLSLFLLKLSDKSTLLSEKIKFISHRSIRDSIILFLKHESVKQQSYSITLPFTKKTLSEKFGVQRTSLSRELQKMKQEGLIDFDSTRIIVLEKGLFKSC